MDNVVISDVFIFNYVEFTKENYVLHAIQL